MVVRIATGSVLRQLDGFSVFVLQAVREVFRLTTFPFFYSHCWQIWVALTLNTSLGSPKPL